MEEVARVPVGTDGYGTYYLILSRQVVSQNIVSNYSLVKIQVALSCPVWINFSSATLKLTSSTGEIGTVNLPTSFNAGTHVIWNNGDGWNLGHNDQGVLDYSVSAYIHATYLLDGTVTGKITAPNIPRYTTVTQALNNKTESTITMNWSTTDIVDHVWYNINDGDWVDVGGVNATSGSYAITNLNPNTTYRIRTIVRRKDSGLTSYTDALPVTTYKIPSNSYRSVGETGLIVDWACDTNVDHVWCSINSGNWIDIGAVNSTSGSYPITGLAPNTTYNIVTILRRNATQTTVACPNMQVTTYDYPHIITVETSNLIIGNSQKLTLYNPLGRNVTIAMCKDNVSGTILYSNATTGTSLSFTPNTSTLYNSIPNSKSSTCVYACTFLSSTRVTSACTYSINENNCKPMFSNYTYADIDSTVIALTGNNQILVNNNSNCKFTISTTDKAIAKNGASITKYKFEWGIKSSEANYSENAEVTSIISDSTGNILKVTAIDSRGLTTAVTKTVVNIPYVNAVINELETQRENGVDVKTFLRGKFSIWKGNWQNGSNSNYANQLKYVGYRVFDGNNWTGYFDITSKVKAVLTTQNGNNTMVLSFGFEKEIEIHANGTSGGFEIGKEYKVQVMIKDGNTTTVFTPASYQATLQADVTDGKVGFSMIKDENGDYHIGINGMPLDDYLVAVNGIGILKMIDV